MQNADPQARTDALQWLLAAASLCVLTRPPPYDLASGSPFFVPHPAGDKRRVWGALMRALQPEGQQCPRTAHWFRAFSLAEDVTAIWDMQVRRAAPGAKGLRALMLMQGRGEKGGKEQCCCWRCPLRCH